MGQRRGPASVALILLVLGVVGLAVVGVAWWRLPGMFGGQSHQMRSATATVVEPAPCATATEGDLVEVRVDGTAKRARFDGCGHSQGQRLPVLVPADPNETFVVQPAPTESEGGGNDLRSRVSWVLATLAAVAGGGYVLLLRLRRVP